MIWNSAWVLLGSDTKQVPDSLENLARRIDCAIYQEREMANSHNEKIIKMLREAILEVINSSPNHARDDHSCVLCEVLERTKRETLK